MPFQPPWCCHDCAELSVTGDCQCTFEEVSIPSLTFLGSLISSHAGSRGATAVISGMLSKSVEVDTTMSVGRRVVGKRGETSGSWSRVGRD